MRNEIYSEPTGSGRRARMRLSAALSAALAAATFGLVPLWLKTPEAIDAGLILFQLFFGVVFVAALMVACREVIRLVISKRRPHLR